MFNEGVIKIKEGCNSGGIYSGTERIGKVVKTTPISWTAEIKIMHQSTWIATIYGVGTTPDLAVDAALVNGQYVGKEASRISRTIRYKTPRARTPRRKA